MGNGKWTPPNDAVLAEEKPKVWTPPLDAIPEEDIKKKNSVNTSSFTEPIPSEGLGAPLQNPSVPNLNPSKESAAPTATGGTTPYSVITSDAPITDLPQGAKPTPTVAEVKKAGGSPTYKNYVVSALEGTGEYISKHLEQTTEGAKTLGQGIKRGGVEGALDLIKGGAEAAFGALSFTPIGAGFNIATETIVPDKVNQWLFSPATKIAESVGYKPKEGTLGEKALSTGDIVGSLLAMHKAGKIVKSATTIDGITSEDINKAGVELKNENIANLQEKIKNQEPLNMQEAQQVKKVVDNATPDQLKQALDENKNLHPEHHFENKVVDVVEKHKEGEPIIKDIAKLDVTKETFDNVVQVAQDGKHLTEEQATDLKKSFENVQTAKEAIPEDHKNNAKIVSLMVDKNELLAAKKNTDKVFHEPIDKQIEVIDNKIRATLGLPIEEKVSEAKGETSVEPTTADAMVSPSVVASEPKSVAKGETPVVETTTKDVSPMKEEVKPEEKLKADRVYQSLKQLLSDVPKTIKEEIYNHFKDITSIKYSEEKGDWVDQDGNEIKQMSPEAERVFDAVNVVTKGENLLEKLKDVSKGKESISKLVAGEDAINPESKVLSEAHPKESIDFAKQMIDSGMFKSLGEKNEQRVDIGLSKEEIERGIRNIKDGENTQAAKTLIEKLNEIKDSGEVPFIQGVGGNAERSSVPLSEMDNIKPPTPPIEESPVELPETNRHKITRAAVNELRKESGLPEFERMPSTVKEDFTEAANTFEKTHKDLAQKIANSDKPVEDRKTVFELALGRSQMIKQARELTFAIEDAQKEGKLELAEELKADRAVVRNNIDVNEQALSKVSSEAAKTLRSFQDVFSEDLSLEATLAEARSLTPDGKITPKQEKAFEEISKRLEEAQVKLAQHEEKVAKLEAQKVIDDLATEDRIAKGIEEGVAKKKFTIKAKAVADEFRKLKTKPPTFKDANGNEIKVFTAGITWNDIIEIGAKTIEKTGEVADGVKAILDHIKEEEWFTKLSDKDKGVFEEQLTSHFEGINPKEDGAIKGLGGAIKQMIRGGVTKESEIVARLKADNPDMTERQIRDEISGYGKTTKLNQDPVEIKYREVKRVSGLIRKLEEIEEGKTPIKKVQGQSERTQEEIDLRNKINDGMQRLAGEKEKRVITDEERWKSNLERYKKRLANELKDLERKRIEKDFEVKKRKPTELDKEGHELKLQVLREKALRQGELTKIELENRSKAQKAWDAAMEITNVPRTIMSSMDFSAPLRQGLVATVAHPILGAKAGLEMFKQAFSQKRFDDWFHTVRDSPEYIKAKKSGLHIADPHDVRLAVKEEAFMNNLAQKIPVVGSLVKGSERAYVGYLNKMRWDVYNQLAEQLAIDGKTFENNPKLYRGLADYVNNSTGRGKIGGSIEKAAPLLNTLLFSPRLIASRINALNPIYYAKLPKEVRIQALKDMGKLLVAGGTVMALAKLNGATVETDPRSSDFGKIKDGKTRYDIWGGHQQYIRVLAQILSGKTKSTNGGKIFELGKKKAFGRTRGDVALAFARGKLAPIPSVVADVMAGTTVVGQPITLKDEAIQHLLPLIYSDLQSVVKEKGAKALFTVGLPSMFGVGVSTYSTDPKKKMSKYKLNQ